MVPDHGTKYEESLSSHHGGMREDGWLDGPGPFLYVPDYAIVD